MAEIFARHRRWYSVRVFSTTSAADVDRAFQYAKKWNYDAVEFDLARDVTPTRDLVVRSALAASSLGEWNGPLMFRVAASEANEFLSRDKDGLAFWNIVFHLPMEEPLARAQTGGFKPTSMRAVTYRLLPGTELSRLKIAFSALRDSGHKSVHLEFPFQSPRARQPWREPQIRSWVDSLRREFPEIDIRAPLGWGMDDPNMPSDETMFPDPVIIHSRETNDKHEPAISVVIPTFEKTIELMNTLRHLFRQRLPRTKFEIIVVDCGSHDTTVKDVEKLMDGDGRGVAMTLMQVPRTVRRKLGDNRYRAGLARNVGASMAKAPLIAFLDDDMLVPKDYLEVVVAELKKPGKIPRVLMGRRHDLRDDVFGVRMSWEKINPATDVRLADRGFWRDFLSQADGWMNLDYPWRFM
ncbi:MAG: glycosyltransferase family 2 protein, partial [Bdellovibrionota bacterium]